MAFISAFPQGIATGVRNDRPFTLTGCGVFSFNTDLTRLYTVFDGTTVGLSRGRRAARARFLFYKHFLTFLVFGSIIETTMNTSNYGVETIIADYIPSRSRPRGRDLVL